MEIQNINSFSSIPDLYKVKGVYALTEAYSQSLDCLCLIDGKNIGIIPRVSETLQRNRTHDLDFSPVKWIRDSEISEEFKFLSCSNGISMRRTGSGLQTYLAAIAGRKVLVWRVNKEQADELDFSVDFIWQNEFTEAVKGLCWSPSDDVTRLKLLIFTANEGYVFKVSERVLMEGTIESPVKRKLQACAWGTNDLELGMIAAEELCLNSWKCPEAILKEPPTTHQCVTVDGNTARPSNGRISWLTSGGKNCLIGVAEDTIELSGALTSTSSLVQSSLAANGPEIHFRECQDAPSSPAAIFSCATTSTKLELGGKSDIVLDVRPTMAATDIFRSCSTIVRSQLEREVKAEEEIRARNRGCMKMYRLSSALNGKSSLHQTAFTEFPFALPSPIVHTEIDSNIVLLASASGKHIFVYNIQDQEAEKCGFSLQKVLEIPDSHSARGIWYIKDSNSIMLLTRKKEKSPFFFAAGKTSSLSIALISLSTNNSKAKCSFNRRIVEESTNEQLNSFVGGVKPPLVNTPDTVDVGRFEKLLVSIQDQINHRFDSVEHLIRGLEKRIDRVERKLN